MSRGPAATTSYAHDADGALTGLTLPDGSHVAITLDASGRPESMTLSAGMLHLGYDNTTGLLNSAMMPNAVGTQGLALTYDGPLLTQQRYTGAAMADVDFAYDELLRVSAVSVAGEATAYSYDRDGLVTSAGAETLTRDPDSGVVTATTVGNVHQIYATSGLMELNLHSATWSGGGNFSESIDSRDGAGRILEKTETGGVRRGYRYDADGRVTGERRGGVVIASYVYDAQGNRTELHRFNPAGVETESRVASYDARDRLLDDGLASYTYDAAGRRASKTMTSTGEVTRYGYDELGHLTRVELPTGTVVEYTYDALGRRTGRTTDGAVDGLTDTAWVYGAGPAPLATLNGDGSMRALWVYSTRSWVPDQLVIPNGASPLVYAVVTDHRGNVRGIVGTRAGLEIFAPADYDAFGNLSAAADVSTRLGYYGFAFAGGILDDATGLLHLGARDYDPETGTWIEPDPIRFGGGDTNLYAYVGGDPVNRIDPTGLLVRAVYNLATGGFWIQDLDTGEQRYMSATSGGHPYGPPIAVGEYDILEQARRPGFYRLDPIDTPRYDDTLNAYSRNHFRLHRPGTTIGCIAANDWHEWWYVDRMIASTLRTTVPDNFSSLWSFGPTPGATVAYYGRLYVISVAPTSAAAGSASP